VVRLGREKRRDTPRWGARRKSKFFGNWGNEGKNLCLDTLNQGKLKKKGKIWTPGFLSNPLGLDQKEKKKTPGGMRRGGGEKEEEKIRCEGPI